MTSLKLRSPFAVPFRELCGDFIPVLHDVLQRHFRSDGLLHLVQRELKLTPPTALDRRIPVRSPRGKMTNPGGPAFG